MACCPLPCANACTSVAACVCRDSLSGSDDSDDEDEVADVLVPCDSAAQGDVLVRDHDAEIRGVLFPRYECVL